MKKILLIALVALNFTSVGAQVDAQKIFDTEKAFEKSAAEKGVNQAFLEFTAPDAVCFFGGQVNCRQYWSARPASSLALFWNPNVVDVSSNGVLAYTTGNSLIKPQDKDDAQSFYGQYATVWQRQPDGRYLAVVDIGISHEKPALVETRWISPPDAGKELNEKRVSAADASSAFFETAMKQSLNNAYRAFLADDVRLLRDGKMPLQGKKAALGEYKNFKSKIAFAKRTFFISAADMAYVSDSYSLTDRNGKATENGNFLQIWKFRGGKWQIVLDVFLPKSN